MHFILFQEALKNAKVWKQPERDTKSSNLGASFFERFLEPGAPKPSRRSVVFAVVILVGLLLNYNYLKIIVVSSSDFQPFSNLAFRLNKTNTFNISISKVSLLLR